MCFKSIQHSIEQSLIYKYLLAVHIYIALSSLTEASNLETGLLNVYNDLNISDSIINVVLIL